MIEKNNSLTISEIFIAMQGESTRAGEKHLFIRLSGCQKRCVYCDTTSALSPQNGISMSIKSIVKLAELHPDIPVTITGGEPLMQGNIFHLIDTLVSRKRDVILFTSGGRNINQIPISVKKIIDIKTPGSGEVSTNLDETINSINHNDELKFVITNIMDIDWSIGFLRRNKMPLLKTVLFSPAWPLVDSKLLSRWIIGRKGDLKRYSNIYFYINTLLHRNKDYEGENYIISNHSMSQG